MSLRTRLVLALLAGPAAAAVDLLVLYVLVYRAQETGTKLSLHVATLGALLVAAAGTIYAWRVKRRETNPQDKFLATLGAVLGAFFIFLILAFEVPTSLLSPEH